MPETASKHPLEDDYKAEMKRRIEAEAKLDEATQEKKKLQNQLSALRREKGIESEAKPPEEKKSEGIALEVPPERMNQPAPENPAPKTEHVVRPWEKFCPDCGGDNPEYKDETECVDCGMSLGAAKYLPKISKCPNGNCNSTKPARLKSHINPKTIDLTGVRIIA